MRFKSSYENSKSSKSSSNCLNFFLGGKGDGWRLMLGVTSTLCDFNCVGLVRAVLKLMQDRLKVLESAFELALPKSFHKPSPVIRRRIPSS